MSFVERLRERATRIDAEAQSLAAAAKDEFEKASAGFQSRMQLAPSPQAQQAVMREQMERQVSFQQTIAALSAQSIVAETLRQVALMWEGEECSS